MRNKKKLKQFNSPLKLLLGLDISKAFSCISISSAVGCGDFLSFKMSLMENGVTDGVLEILSVFSVNSSSILSSLQVYNRSTPLLHNIKLISHKFLERISQAYRRILSKKKKIKRKNNVDNAGIKINGVSTNSFFFYFYKF